MMGVYMHLYTFNPGCGISWTYQSMWSSGVKLVEGGGERIRINREAHTPRHPRSKEGWVEGSPTLCSEPQCCVCQERYGVRCVLVLGGLRGRGPMRKHQNLLDMIIQRFSNFRLWVHLGRLNFKLVPKKTPTASAVSFLFYFYFTFSPSLQIIRSVFIRSK